MEKMMLKEKNAIVVGASKGMGKSIAKLFALNGAHVTLMSRSEEDLLNVIKEIREKGGSADYIVMDISRIDSVKVAFSKYKLLNKRIDILVNSSGIYLENIDTYNEIGEVNIDVVYNLINTNLLGYWWSTNLFKQLVNDEGSIINISSVNGIIGKGSSDIYDITKAGVNNLTLNQARQLSSRKIRVNAICPSSTITPMRDQAMSRYLKNKNREEFDAQEADTIPFKRLCNPEEIADAALFLASDGSKYITGQIISIDGGFLLKPTFFGEQFTSKIKK